MLDAPYHNEVAFGPVPARALWREADDGVRLRIGLWPCAGAQATVLIFSGRTEYLEKYGHVAADLNAAGYAVASIDWRGQGLSDRLIEPMLRGHVGKFTDYQKDVATLMQTVKDEGLPRVTSVLSHSMGGAIALRALMDGLPVTSAVFSAPMWGILMSAPLRPIAWGVSRIAAGLRLGGTLSPGTTERAYMINDPFDDNTLTRDQEMWDGMTEQLRCVPELELGGPSLDWVREAMDECALLARRASPKLPTLTYLGANERIVDPDAIHARMAHWPEGELRLIQDAEHEVLMEIPETRTRITREIVGFLGTHSAA